MGTRRVSGFVHAWVLALRSQLLAAGLVVLAFALPHFAYATAPRVSGGAYHSLALAADGSVRAWGYNASGQLGNGTNTQSNVPVTVLVPGGNGIIAIAAGGQHSLALKSDGTVYAWGSNASGQLGDNTTTDRNTPVQSQGLGAGSGVIAIAAGSDHSLALKSNGAVVTWGSNSFGQIGDGTFTNRVVPTQVIAPGSGVIAIAAGLNHAFALKADGTVLAWGYNGFGQLGDGTTVNRSIPTTVMNAGSNVVALAGGGLHSLALRLDGSVIAWGGNGSGQLGDGTTTTRTAPVQVLPAGSATAVSAGQFHSLARKTSDALVAWGANTSGQLGTGNTTQQLLPTQAIAPGQGVITFSAGWNHVLVYVAHVAGSPDASVVAWGSNSFGQLGDTTTTDRSAAVTILSLPVNWGVIATAAGNGYSLFLKQDGQVLAVGYNAYGGLGTGNTTNAPAPVQVLPPGSGIVAIKASENASFVLKADGTVLATGLNDYGALGDGTATTRSSFVQTFGSGSGVVAVEQRLRTGVAVKSDGSLWAWGLNNYGQVGDGTNNNALSPVQVLPAGSGVIAAAVTSTTSYALKSDGTVWGWGANSNGELGNPGGASNVPIQILGPGSGIVAIAAGSYHAVALREDGAVVTWGYNYYGQLGDGTATSRFTPVVAMPPGSGIVEIRAGEYQTFARRSDGAIFAWGYNSHGEQGNGTTTGPSVPAMVLAAPNGFSSLTAGSFHTLWLRKDGRVLASGDNTYGQLGDGTVATALTPTPTLVSQEVLVDLQPADYAFATVRNATPGAIVSQPVLISGPGILAPIHVQGGDYSIGCTGTYQTGWGAIGGGQNLCVRVTVPAVPEGTASARIRIGSVARTFHATRLPVDGGVVAIAAADNHALALKFDGRVVGWGYSPYGQVGDGTVTTRVIPAEIFPSGSGVVAVAVGANHSLALKSDGTVYGWGYNDYGQVGDGTTTERHAPVQVIAPGSGVVAIAALDRGSLALKSDGTVLGWGANYYGQLGNNATPDRFYNPTVVLPAGSGVIEIAARASHTHALKADGSMWAWGYNGNGELGDGTATSRYVPTQILPTGSDLVSIAAGIYHGLAVRADGSFLAWGYNNYGRLGDGTQTNRLSPEQLSIPGQRIVSLSASHHSRAVTASGATFAWGYNGYGELGDGTTNYSVSPEQISAASGVAAVTSGTYMGYIIHADGTVQVAGYDGNGELGDGATTSRATLGTNLAGVVALPPLQPMVLDFAPKVSPNSGGYVTSDPVTVTGVNAGAPILVTGGDYSIGCTGSFQSGWGTISAGQTLCVRVVVSSTEDGTSTANVRINNVVRSFTVTTAPPTQPDAPTNVVATASPASASVSFTAPAANGSPITGYTVTSSPGGFVGTGGSSPIVVNGLVNGTSYTFTVVATNAIGSGPASLPSNSVIPKGVSATAVQSSANPSTFGSSVTFTATVSGSAGTPAGTVAFRDSATTISGCGSVLLASGQAQCAVATLSVGSHPIAADYSGGLVYLASTSPTLTQTVNGTTLPPAYRRTDFNLDGKGDIILRNTSDGSLLLWLMNGLSVSQQASLGGAGTTGQPIHVADFNGDGKADLLWQDANGDISMKIMDGVNVVSTTLLVAGGSGWSASHVGDFNGDGKADIIWTNADGSVQAWLMDGPSVLQVASFVPAGSGWSVHKIADIDGDGKSDIFWIHTSGAVQAWQMNGLNVAGVASYVAAGSGWTIALAADVDGDGKQDLVWQNTNGAAQVWLMNGLSVAQVASMVPAGAGYTATQAGDLNGDGKQDLIWRGSDGTVIAWLMGPALTVSQVASFTGTGNTYVITHVRDLDGDGKADLLWKAPDGTILAWIMNGLTATSIAQLVPAGPYVVVP